jgi:uncharacterized protein (TIGR02186 family)
VRAVAVIAAALIAGAQPARAEGVTAVLSSEIVPISSSFQGTQLALIGVIGPDENTATRRGAYDAVVIVRGPSRAQTVWRRERLGPIWINGEFRTYVAAPVLYATLSNRPLSEVALDPVRTELDIGLDTLRLTQRWVRNDPVDDQVFRNAFLDIRREDGLYSEESGPDALRFLVPNVFRARIDLPSNVPIGFFTVEVLVLSEGFVVGRESTSFRVEKVGFEAAVFQASRNQPILYGIATVVLALGTGWAAGLLLRRG